MKSNLDEIMKHSWNFAFSAFWSFLKKKLWHNVFFCLSANYYFILGSVLSLNDL
jgi:hypothetical protein